MSILSTLGLGKLDGKKSLSAAEILTIAEKKQSAKAKRMAAKKAAMKKGM